MLRNSALILFSSLLMIACGGGGGSGESTNDSSVQSATVGILITDASSDDFDEAIATISSVDLLCENGQQNLFTGSATFDLLRLKNFVEMLTVTEGIQPDTCDKIRLQLDSLVLNVLNDNGDITSSIDAKLVANGKIDLKPNSSFVIRPGETLFVSLDFDVDRSLQFTETGNGEFVLRPVIFVEVGNYPGFKNGLTRLFGYVEKIETDATAMQICMDKLTAQPISMDAVDILPERCLRVDLAGDTGVFAEDGLPIQANELLVNDPVTIVGTLAIATENDTLQSFASASDSNQSDDDSHDKGHDGESDHDDGDDDGDSDSDSDGNSGTPPPARPFVLEAIVVERGPRGHFVHLSGTLKSGVDPRNDTVEILIAPDQGFAPDSVITGQLFGQSRIIDPNGADIDRALLNGEDQTIVDGILLLKNNDSEPNILRSALMIVRQGASIQPPDAKESVLIGKILSIDQQTVLIATDTGDRCVNGNDATVLFLVESDGSLEAIKGTIGELADGSSIVNFGTENGAGCFDAEVIISHDPPISPKPS